jgi:hypothetical protein
VFAVVDAKLLLQKAYVVRYQEKLLALQNHFPELTDLIALTEAAWHFRQQPQVAMLDLPLHVVWERTCTWLLRTFAHLMHWLYAWDAPFGSPLALARFLYGYFRRDPHRSAIEAAQYLTLAAWEKTGACADYLTTAQQMLAYAGIPCPSSAWPDVRRCVVEAWFQYCH